MSLERQTVTEGIEILVMELWGAHTNEHERVRHRFQTVGWVYDPRGRTVPQLRSLGIAKSQGAIVALLEDDCVVPETWCAAVLKAHQGTIVAVGGAVEPGAYSNALDWAVYFSEYARFMEPVPEGESHDLPGTNVSYKRTALLELLRRDETLGNTIGRIGFYEVLVHWALRHAGQPMRMDRALVAYNMSSWGLSQALRSRFHHGRGFAAMRAANRSPGARLRFLAIAAVLPFVQVARILKEVIRRRRFLRKIGSALPWITLLSISWSMGEFVGYLLGPGGSLSRWR